MEAADTSSSSSDRQHQQKGEEDGTKKQHHQLMTADDKSGAVEAEEKYRGWKAMPYVIGELSCSPSLHHRPFGRELVASILFLRILPPSIIILYLVIFLI
jgi:hypothetical protein